MVIYEINKKVKLYPNQTMTKVLDSLCDYRHYCWNQGLKADKFDKMLIIADRFYPSTQRCSNYGHIKTGDEKITLSGNQKQGTKHNEYVCYSYGFVTDRDHNAVLNLLALA